MKILETRQYSFLKNKILKKKKLYACLDNAIKNFFIDHNTFEKVYESNYFIQAKAGLKIIKIRLPNKTMNQGKSGGYRLILACNSKTESIVLLTVYPKLGNLGKSDLETSELTKLLKGLKMDIAENSLKNYSTPKIQQSDKTKKKLAKKKQGD